MAEERVQRRLAAILAADVVGYSRLMELDEAGTLATLKAVRVELIDPKVSEYSGRIVNTTGDGILIEFPSAVDAVEHAVDIQQALAHRNIGVSELQQFQLRIGINIGDVIIDDGDIFGDGVNVAARLEGLAEPGGISVSGMVYESVRNRLDVVFDDLGEQALKNIANPVRIFRVVAAAKEDALGSSIESEAMFRRPAVAVLPFENMSGDPEQEYFADGLTEDIITALALWRSFPVIARNSTFAYKGKSPDIRQVGEELGARYVIEGSVRKTGNRVRVTAQLINAENGHHVWAERYDRDLEDIFALQDELTGKIAATIAPELERIEYRRTAGVKLHNLNAWECVTRGNSCLHEFTENGFVRGRELFERAVEFDPNYSMAMIGIAWSHIWDLTFAYSNDRDESVAKALEAARRAVDADPSESEAHHLMGIALLWGCNHESAILELDRAINLNPNNSSAQVTLGNLLTLVGRPDDGIPHMERGFQLNPQHPRNHIWFTFMARAHLTARRYEEAAKWARDAVQWKGDAPLPHLILSASLGHLGQSDDARRALEMCERIRPGYMMGTDNWQPYKNAEDEQHLFDGLRKAGLANN